MTYVQLPAVVMHACFTHTSYVAHGQRIPSDPYMTHTPEDRVTVSASQKDLVKWMTKRDLCFAHTVVKDVDEKQGLAFAPRRLTENEKVLIEQLRAEYLLDEEEGMSDQEASSSESTEILPNTSPQRAKRLRMSPLSP